MSNLIKLQGQAKPSKVYLDQIPEVSKAVETWLGSLDLDPWFIEHDRTLEPLECRRRDGFIPHSHNHGGFDLMYRTDLTGCFGSGCGPDLQEIQDTIDWALKQARREFYREHAAELQAARIPFIKCTYPALCNLGRDDLAEQLSETENAFLDTPVWWGVRCMYEGSSDGVHTLMIYCGANVSEYHNAFQKGSTTLAEFEVKFKTVTELSQKLSRLTKRVNQAF